MLIAIACGAFLGLCYVILRWALSLFIPECVFRSFEHGFEVVTKLLVLAALAGVIGMIVYAMNFMPA